jgi:mRNA interferase MazF
LAILCPVTSQAKGYPFEVGLPEGGDVSGVVLSDQVKSLDWRARRADLIESLPPEVTDEVLQKLATLLD